VATGASANADAATVAAVLSQLHSDANGGSRLPPALCMALRSGALPPRPLHRLLSAAALASGLAKRPPAAKRAPAARQTSAKSVPAPLVSWDALRALLGSPRFQHLDTPAAVQRVAGGGDWLRALLAEVATAPELAPAAVARSCSKLAAHLSRWCRALHALLQAGWAPQDGGAGQLEEGQQRRRRLSGRGQVALEKRLPEVWLSPTAQRFAAQCAVATRLRDAAVEWLDSGAAANSGGAGRWRRELRELYSNASAKPLPASPRPLHQEGEEHEAEGWQQVAAAATPPVPPPSKCAPAEEEGAAESMSPDSAATELAELDLDEMDHREGTGGVSPWGSPVPTHCDTRQQLLEFYAVHNPTKLHEVDTILADWAGQEVVLFACLHKKYGLVEGGLYGDDD